MMRVCHCNDEGLSCNDEGLLCNDEGLLCNLCTIMLKNIVDNSQKILYYRTFVVVMWNNILTYSTLLCYNNSGRFVI